MIDKFDYAEPSCVLCGGEEFYYPQPDAPKGTIPIRSVVAKLDAAEGKNNLSEAVRLLEYWEQEGISLGDERGLLSVYSEQMGLFRKLQNVEKGLRSVENGLLLLEKLGLSDTVSGATIMLNAATTLKAFGKAEQSIPLYEKVQSVYDRLLSPDDPKKTGFYNNAALAFADLKEYARAEDYYKNALAVLSKTEGNENEIAITFVNLAHLVEQFDGREEESYHYMEKALAVLHSQPNKNSAYALTCDKCAPSFGYFGYFLAEEELKRTAKEIYERA